MAHNNLRRSRLADADDDEESRPATPLSTTPNDRKRARRSRQHADGTPTTGPDASIGIDDTHTSRSQRNHVPQSGMPKVRPAHQPGAIVRVKLTNFVTYTSAEFFPGPNLNMVIGPNGTGKSTLVCAICLGLGWGTQYLGRAKDAAEFVKHGCREATIEIELQRAVKGKAASRVNPVITRTIKREGNKSTYTLNDSQTSGKAIMSLAQSYNIQIDNLCQFLPQDKVVEFAQMTPIQILESTQRAAAPPSVLQMHQDLRDLRTQQRELMNNNKGDREQLTNLENRQDMQRTEVERLRERAAVQKKLGWLEQCRPIPQYADAKSKAKEARNRAKTLKDELKALQKETQPALQKVNAKQIYVKEVNSIKQQRSKNVKRAEQECERVGREIALRETTMKDCEAHVEAERKSLQTNKATIARENGNITRLKHQQDSPPEQFDSRAMNQEIQNRTSQQRAFEAELDQLQAQALDLKEQKDQRLTNLRRLQSEQDRLSTNEGQLEEKLKSMSNDTYRAWEWIKQNKELFNKPVFGPPLVECSLKDPSRASHIESLLQANDFKIITTQTTEDFKLLQRELINKQRLHDISLRQCDYDSLDRFQRPITQDQMNEYGLDIWAIDLIDGPPTVLAMLCQERFLHQTAVTDNDIGEEQYGKLVQTAVKGYVSKTVGFQFSRRKEYGNAGNSAKSLAIRPARFWNTQSADGGRRAENQARINELKGELGMIKEQFEPLRNRNEELKRQLSTISEEIQGIKEDKDAKQRALTEYNGLETKIAQAQAKIDTAQQNINSFKERIAEFRQSRDQAMFEKADMVLKYVETVHIVQTKMRELLEIEVVQVVAENDFETLSARNKNILELIKRKTVEEKESSETAGRENAKAVDLRDKVMALRDEGLKLEEQEGDRGLLEVLESLAHTDGVTEQHLDELVEIEKAKLELTEGGDANAVKEFEDRAKKIERLRGRMAEYTAKQVDYIKAIKEVRETWEPELDRLVSKISDAFGDSFARIGCAGQVAVHKASSDDPADCTEEMGGIDNGLDFANWAIHISVKFRESEPLSLLDSHRQSGGERAVSTIFYLMALQSLSRAPFRVVDEINQGMDPRNERMVHGRMVDIAAASSPSSSSKQGEQQQGSQYFLITPKLLSGLKYRPGMTVLCIVSGESMPNAGDERKKDQDGRWVVTPGKKIDFREFARMGRELGMNSGTSSSSPPSSMVGRSGRMSTMGNDGFGTFTVGSHVEEMRA